jgi:hypothetical protein
MYYGDHAPPRFHAVYRGETIKVDCNILEVIKRDMNCRAQALVIDRAGCTARNSGKLGTWPVGIKNLPKLRGWNRIRT